MSLEVDYLRPFVYLPRRPHRFDAYHCLYLQLPERAPCQCDSGYRNGFSRLTQMIGRTDLSQTSTLDLVF